MNKKFNRLVELAEKETVIENIKLSLNKGYVFITDLSNKNDNFFFDETELEKIDKVYFALSL